MPCHGAPSPLRLRAGPISLQGVMGTITLGTRFSVCLRSCWVQYFWVYGVPVLPDGFSCSARSVLRLSFHLDGLPQATVRDKVLGLRFCGGTSVETTVHFIPWEKRVAIKAFLDCGGPSRHRAQPLPGSRRPRCHRGTSPGQRSTASWTVTAAQVATARNVSQSHRVQPGSRRQFVSPRQLSRGS